MESNTALDLTHLNENEREVILAVLRRDEEFEKREKERVRRLKGTVEIQRRAGHVSPTTERGLIAKTGEWFTKKYRSVIGATPLVKISLHSAKLSSSRRGSETSDNSSKPDIIPLNGQEAVSEVEMERVLAPVLVQSFPILINEQPTKQSPQPTKQSPQSSPEVNRRQKLREQTKSKSPLVSSGSDSEVFNPGSMPSPEDRNQVTRQSTIDRLASDRRYLKVLPTGSLDSAVPTAAPMLVHLERIAQKSPPSSPRVPPQRNNTPHSPFGSREGTPQRVSALTSFDKGRRSATPEILSQSRERTPVTVSREPSPVVSVTSEPPLKDVTAAKESKLALQETVSSASGDSHSSHSTPQPEGYLSPFRGGGLLRKQMSGSGDSLSASTYSLAGRGKNITVTGQLYFGVRHNHLTNQLEVNIIEARGLAPANSNGTSDPYVKTYLLPDKSKESKRKTPVLRKTLNPVFNKTLTYKIRKDDVGMRRLWVAIYDWDRFGHNSFLGEVRLDLSEHDLTASMPQWYDLQELNPDEGLPVNRGEVLLALRFMPQALTEAQQSKKIKKKKESKGDFQVLIKRARNLAAMDPSGLSDPFIKCYLLPDRSRSSKHKTKTIFRDLNPIWEEMIQYKGITLDALQHRVLEVTVWDFDRAGSNDFIGGLRLGMSLSERDGNKKKSEPWMDSNDVESAHWKEMMENPGTFIGRWHTLRSSMDPH